MTISLEDSHAAIGAKKNAEHASGKIAERDDIPGTYESTRPAPIDTTQYPGAKNMLKS